MAYVPNNLICLLNCAPVSGEVDGTTTSPNGGLVGGSIWKYYSAADAKAAVAAANYFSDAQNKGMQPGDLVIATATDATWLFIVSAVASTGATLTAGASLG